MRVTDAGGTGLGEFAFPPSRMLGLDIATLDYFLPAARRDMKAALGGREIAAQYVFQGQSFRTHYFPIRNVFGVVVHWHHGESLFRK